MHKIFIGIIFCFLFVEIQAQNRSEKKPTGTITGKISDEQTGEAVEFANVLLYTGGSDTQPVSHTVTKTDGTFALEYTKAGEYYLVVSFIGYESKKVPLPAFTEKQKDIIVGNISMKQSKQELSEVEVVGQKRQIIYKLDKRVIEAAGFLSAAGGTAVDILQQTPSMSVNAEGELSFRGSTGFKVYVDGKPATLEGTAALEQIPAGQIDNIEVITTPSAKHEADGTAGIINVVTKKQSAEGWSGMVNLMGSSVMSGNVDFLVSLRRKDIRWQVSGEASRRYLLSDFEQWKTITNPETTTTDLSTGDRERRTDNYYLRTGLDWYKGNTVWSAAITGGYRDRWRGGDLHYEDTYRSTATDDLTEASFNGSDYVNLYEWNLRGDAGMEHRFPGRKGHTLTASLYGLYQGDAMEYFQTDMFDLGGNRVQGHKAWEYEYRFTAQANADYVLPLNDKDNKLEAGYYFYTYTEDGDYKIDMFDPAIKDFVRRDDLFNKYLFRRDVHALYAMLSDTYSQFSYKVGLREEYTYRKLGNSEEWARHTWHRFDLFPSVHLALALNKGNRIGFAYSRRITQPQLFYMEPYIVYVDFYTAQRGNPFVLPEYTNSFEGSYTKAFKNNSVTGTLFHRIRKDKIERVRVPYQTNVTLDSMANVGNDYSTGAELSTMLQFSSWWSLDANGSLYYYRIKNDYKTNGEDEESWNWQLAVNNNFDLAKNTRLRLEAYYVGPTVSTQGRVNEFFYVNLTLRQQFFNRRLIAGLSVRDILSTAKYVSTQSGIGLESLTKIYPRSPLFTLTLAYTFNNFKSKKKEESNTHDLFEGTNR